MIHTTRSSPGRASVGSRIVLGLLTSCWLFATPAHARPLGADHLALLYNSRSEASRQLAEYYARARDVPADRLLGLDVPITDTLPRLTYEQALIPRLRAALADRWKDKPVRCFVTFYDLPIRVGNRRPSSLEKDLADRARDRRRRSADDLRILLGRFESLARAQPPPPPPDPPLSTDLLLAAYESAKHAAHQRIGSLEPPLRSAASHELLKLLERSEGSAGVLGMIRLTVDADEADRNRLRLLMKQATRAQAEINEQIRRPPGLAQRRETWKRIRAFKGLVGLIHFLEEDRAVLLGDETQASLDSELSLLNWEGYRLYRWVMNLHNFRHHRDPKLREAIPAANWRAPLYLVARLDGPSPDIVRRMIDDALAAEETGLRGNVYVDARGYTKDDGYLLFDRDLLQLADLLKNAKNLPVTLDQREAVFSAGQCPETALYAGWYSHRTYVDAFEFVRGAVAYHAASSEAVSLRDPSKHYWCKSLLADGAAATMGPVDEPYLAAFPMPKDFFGLLVTGRYTLVECYYYAKNFNSWMMLLLGDPLYRPYAADPRLTVDQVVPPELLPLADLSAASTRPIP